MTCGEHEPERRAASELKFFVGLLSEAEPDAEFRIGVKYLDLFPDDKEALGFSDGYAVRQKDGVVYIVSPQPRGCLYGVYDFLERNSDIIWARPDEECGTVYTRTREFVIREAEFRERPVFQVRGWWLCGTFCHAPSEYWNARMRCNFECGSIGKPGVLERGRECGFIIHGSSGHNMGRFLTDHDYAAHPEYFALVDGVRRQDQRRTQLCFSNMEGARQLGRRVAMNISERRKQLDFELFAIKQEDNQTMCDCAGCRADFIAPDGRVRRFGDENFWSDRFFAYLNEVVKEIRPLHPDIRIETFAYLFSAPPPDFKIDDSVNAVFCPFIKNDRLSVLEAENARWRRRAEEWSTATSNLVWREYWGCAGGFPRPHSPVAQKDLAFINGQLGFTRVYSETLPDQVSQRGTTGRERWDVSAVEHWVLSRLMWNPYRDVEKLYDEYFTRSYRSAGPAVARFYSAIRRSWFSDRHPSNYCDDAVGNAVRYIVRAGIEDELGAALFEATESAKGDLPQVRMLVSRLRARYDDWLKNAKDAGDPPIIVPFVVTRDWTKAAKSEEFVYCQRRAGAKSASGPLRKTHVLLMHDRKNLYVRYVCDDPEPETLSVSPKRPEDSPEVFPGGEHIEFGFIPNGDDFYHFAVNVNGDRGDQKNGISSWNGRWAHEIRRTATGYEVDLTVDLSQWSIELSRCNRFGANFTRMSKAHGDVKGQEFTNWRGIHPQTNTRYAEIVLEME